MIRFERKLQALRLGMVAFSILGGSLLTAGCATPSPADDERDESATAKPVIDSHSRALSMWEKSGGGSGEEACWGSTHYQEFAEATASTCREAYIRACDRALDRARDRCNASARVCAATPTNENTNEETCESNSSDSKTASCIADLDCEYSFW